MSALLKTAALLGIIAGAVQAQTTVTEITSSASEALPGLPNSGVADGSIFVLYGKNLGPTALLQQSSATTLPTSLGGTQVSFTGGSVTAPAPLFYTSAGQVAGILPSNIPPGTATVSVTYNSGTPSTAFSFTVVANNFSPFTLNGSGTGPAVAFDSNLYSATQNVNQSIVTATNSAQPGDFIVLYGTGAGAVTSGSDATIPPPQVNLSTTISVYLGNLQLTANQVTYHGRSGDAGLDQVNFQIPSNVNLGCYVPVIVQSSSAIVSSIATISIAATRGTACSDSNGVPLSSLTPGANGTIAIGGVSLSQSTSTLPSIAGFGGGTSISSGASASFYSYSQAQLTTSASFISQPSVGGCTVSYLNLANLSSLPSINATGLNAGTPITVSGPANFTLTANSGATGSYSGNSLTTALPAGTYSATGPGGSQVGAFTTSINLSTPLTWTNSGAVINVTRASGQLITWSGGAPNSYVQIEGYSSNSTNGTSGVEAIFICIAPVAAQQFTIPAAVLLGLPVSAQIVSGVAGGSLIVGNYTENSVTPPPSGLNYFYTSTTVSTSILVNYQ